MNAPHIPTDAIPTTREHELAVMVERILDDHRHGRILSAVPKVEWEFYVPADWRDAAEYAADSQDFSDLETMLAKESMFQGWMALSEREQCEWGDFASYFDARNRDRVRAPVDCTDAIRFPNIAQAAADLAAMPADERERLNREWAA